MPPVGIGFPYALAEAPFGRSVIRLVQVCRAWRSGPVLLRSGGIHEGIVDMTIPEGKEKE